MKKKLFLIPILLFISISNAFAATTGSAMPWDSALTKVMDSLTGRTAVIIGTILIVGGGIAVAATEGQAVKKLMWVVVGIGIAINAANLVVMFFPEASGFIF